MMSAEALWSKAIEMLQALKKPEVALYSNRAMARLNLNRPEDALADTEEAIKLDKAFVKSYYRKGQALQRLKRFDEAIAAYEAGQGLEASNKVWAEAIE